MAGLIAAGSPVAAAGAPAEGACSVRTVAAQERVMMKLIAAERRAEGVRAVRGNGRLLRAGRAWSRAMAGGATFGHSGSLPWARGRLGGQNIAMAPNARIAFRMMMASPGHRANLVSPAYRLIGVGAARACDRQVFFTLNFLGPRR